MSGTRGQQTYISLRLWSCIPAVLALALLQSCGPSAGNVVHSKTTTTHASAPSTAKADPAEGPPTLEQTTPTHPGDTLTLTFKNGQTGTFTLTTPGYWLDDTTGRRCLLYNDLLNVSTDRRVQCEESRRVEAKPAPSRLVWFSTGGLAGVIVALLVMGLGK